MCLNKKQLFKSNKVLLEIYIRLCIGGTTNFIELSNEIEVHWEKWATVIGKLLSLQDISNTQAFKSSTFESILLYII